MMTALVLLAIFRSPASAGIPEPDLVWYGQVRTVSGGNTVRLTTGTLRWRITPPAGGIPWELTTPLANINDQFSFVLRVPCESPEPGVAATSGSVVLSVPATNYGRVTVTLDGQPLALGIAPSTFSPLPTDRGRAERIDLTLGSLPPDSDGDGMPDDWETLHFGPSGAEPGDDADGDGESNLDEFRAGTNPRNAGSVFKVIEIKTQSGGIRIRWTSQANKVYRIRRATTLLASQASYGAIQTGLAATPPNNEFLDTTTAGNAQFFYLIEIVD